MFFEYVLKGLKLILALALLPLTAIVTHNFYESLNSLPLMARNSFLFGILVFVAIYLFLGEWQGVYKLGQKITTGFLGFYAPLAKIASRMVPFYSILILLTALFLNSVYKLNRYGEYFMFFGGLFFGMHVVFTARQVREEEEGIIKPNYLLGIQFVYVFMIFLMVLVFALIFQRFSFFSFIDGLIETANDFYMSVFRKFFLP